VGGGERGGGWRWTKWWLIGDPWGKGVELIGDVGRGGGGEEEGCVDSGVAIEEGSFNNGVAGEEGTASFTVFAAVGAMVLAAG
jgi:hypothetical protein